MEQGLIKKSGRTPEVVAAEIRTFTASMLNSVIEIGRRLCEAKEMLPQGEFDAWVKENTGYGRSTAYNFMKLYAEYGDQQGSLFGASLTVQTFGRLTYTKALALLEIPSGERESFVESNNVESMSTRELQDAIRERDAAQREISKLSAQLDKAQKSEEKARAEASHAEESRRKMAEDMSHANNQLQLAKAELQELRNRPVDVAVQRDEAAIEEARQEVRAEMTKELDAANARTETLRQRLDETKQALAEAERKAKESAIGNTQAISDFKSYYDQTQELVNKMNGILLKLVQKDPETAGKLGKALLALSDAIKKEAARPKEAAV